MSWANTSRWSAVCTNNVCWAVTLLLSFSNLWLDHISYTPSHLVTDQWCRHKRTNMVKGGKTSALDRQQRPKRASEQTCKALNFEIEIFWRSMPTASLCLQQLSQLLCPCCVLSSSESRLQHCDRLLFVVRVRAVLNERPNTGRVWTNINTSILNGSKIYEVSCLGFTNTSVF